MLEPIHAYIMLDTSASMNGAPLEALKRGLQVLVGTFIARSKRPTQISLITYDSTAKQIMPLADVQEFGAFNLPPLEAAGSSGLGGALRLTSQQMPDHDPTLIYVFTDGTPTDDWENALTALRPRISKIYGLLCGLIADPQQVEIASAFDKLYRPQEVTAESLFETFRGLN